MKKALAQRVDVIFADANVFGYEHGTSQDFIPLDSNKLISADKMFSLIVDEGIRLNKRLLIKKQFIN